MSPLAIKLGQARVLACLTQARLAERMGVSRGVIAWAAACGCRFAWTIEVSS